MSTTSRNEIIHKAMRKFGLRTPDDPLPRQDAVDTAGNTYHIKYRTEGRLSSLSFDFVPEELSANYDYFLGVFITERGVITEAFRVRRAALPHMVNKNQDSLRLRWNDATRADHRIEPL